MEIVPASSKDKLSVSKSSKVYDYERISCSFNRLLVTISMFHFFWKLSRIDFVEGVVAIPENRDS